jgi:hypothetical protein
MTRNRGLLDAWLVISCTAALCWLPGCDDDPSTGDSDVRADSGDTEGDTDLDVDIDLTLDATDTASDAPDQVELSDADGGTDNCLVGSQISGQVTDDGLTLGLCTAILTLGTFDWPDMAVIGLLVILEGVLSIDNALVLGLLAKRLPRHQRAKALSYGIIGAFVFRTIAVLTAAYLLQWTFVKFVGGAYLVSSPSSTCSLRPGESREDRDGRLRQSDPSGCRYRAADYSGTGRGRDQGARAIRRDSG